MMQIVPLPALTDNYIWLLRQGNQAIVVDPGEAAVVMNYLAAQALNLNAIWLTHAHYDHTDGVAALKQHYPQCQVAGWNEWPEVNRAVNEGSEFEVFGQQVAVWYIPGHTADHLAYILTDSAGQQRVFCGDTLFSAGCGRVFTGTMAQMFASLQRLNSLPENTLFYPAHEYTAANLKFAQAVEPDNPAIRQALLQTATLPTLPVNLAHEREINPFLRTSQPPVIASVVQKGLSEQQSTEPLAVFTYLREWKNRF
ncbi:hydroxyacylglutathione hydrolase [Snodgrassella communis]|uniref:hydroxyacylglutathione hydrolase n=1 Tax=Snodgrassella communis TaxID=2946699 RepID=UPI000C1ECAB7|nr:hydroxyacylglutathione hydrolase [Snodgrassella communis]PIT21587.1 hydroxyacylglutathione hydrolase [Snodgrassella communis]